MTQEEKVALLKEAGVWDVIGFPGCIDKLIALVAAHEREKQAEQEPVAERKAQVNELIKESARLIASISDEGDRYLTAIDTLRNAYRLGLKDAAPVQQEPVGMVIGGVFEPWNDDILSGAHELYAAPVRTKDLTDGEVAKAVGSPLDEVYLADFRAVIAADREKNK